MRTRGGRSRRQTKLSLISLIQTLAGAGVFIQTDNTEARDSNIVASRLFDGIHHVVGALHEGLGSGSIDGVASHADAGMKLDMRVPVMQPMTLMKNHGNASCYVQPGLSRSLWQ